MKIGQLQNIEIKDNSALISINPNIYTLSAIFSAAYFMCDDAFITIDGDPSEEILVEIKSKKGEDVTPLIHKFNEELINHIVYEERDMHTKEIKRLLMQKILLPKRFEKYVDKAIIEKITKKEIGEDDGLEDIKIK